MAKPIMSCVRKSLKHHAEAILAERPGAHSSHVSTLAGHILDYEATLAKKDEQIERIRKAWDDLGKQRATHEEICECAADISDDPCTCGYHDAWNGVDAAIGEATS